MTASWIFGELRSTGGDSPLEIVKVGGSLLARPGWPSLLTELVHARSARRSVLIVVGGGAIVDGLRVIDAAAPGAPPTTHALAVDLMGTTARLVADALALPIVPEPGADSAEVLDAARWLAAEGRLARLPIGWHVTSDSIAALVATETAGDLLLAKRIAPPPSSDSEGPLVGLSRGGWVDAHFPLAAARIGRIGWAAPRSVPGPRVGGPAPEGCDTVCG